MDTSDTNNINSPSETDLLNDPEAAIETSYNIEKEKISQVNIKESNGNNQTRNPYLLYGNQRALFYKGDYPLIIIGPDCKLN